MSTEPQAPEPSHEQTTWGVGPWMGELPTEDFYDPELLREGDTRNVLDKYRYWKMEAIVADLDIRRHSFHVAIENWQHDLNIGSIVRTANAFLAAEVHIVGHKRWNRRGAMVTDRYQHVRHHPTVEEFVTWAKAEALPIIAIDNVPGCKQIETYDLPENCVLLFGQEGPGLSEAAIAASEVVLEITQFGSTRSINASAAAAITMHSWVMRHVFKK
jgi:tRNA G18 (ribose-2'-O)-methylase SpoU